MHKGHAYPFADQFWLIETQFWPDFVPRKFSQSWSLSSAGTTWNALNGSLWISTPVQPSTLVAGDAFLDFVYTFPYTGRLRIQKFGSGLTKSYTGTLTVDDGLGNLAIAQCPLLIPSNGLWFQTWETLTNDPPRSLPGNFIFGPTIPATWGQV